MTRHLQNWIQSILIGKSDFLGQGPHHPNNIVSVVFGIFKNTFSQQISHISCSIYTREMKIGSINCFSQPIPQRPLDLSYNV